MNAIATTASPIATPGSRPSYRLTGVRVLRSEWIKMWSLRSTPMTVGLAQVFLIVFGVIGAASYQPLSHGGFSFGPVSDPVQLALGAIDLVLLTVGVLGVLQTGGEYTTGSIRSTMAAVPRRLPVLWSKAALTGAVVLVTGTAGAVVSYGVGEGLLHGKGIGLPLTAPGVLRSLLLAAAAMALVSIMGVSLGALLRSMAGAITTLAALLLVLPALALLLPATIRTDISPYLLGNAANSMFALHRQAGALSPATGFAVVAAWTAAATVGAVYRLVRSDV